MCKENLSYTNQSKKNAKKKNKMKLKHTPMLRAHTH